MKIQTENPLVFLLGLIITIVFVLVGLVYQLRWPITIGLVLLILFQGRF